jgi:hypothetical protein
MSVLAPRPSAPELLFPSVLFVLLFAFLAVFLFVPDSARAQVRHRTITALGPAEAAKTQRQHEWVTQRARRHLGVRVTGREIADLVALQRLLDERFVREDDVLGQQALGVVLGEVMAHTLGLEWVIVDDDIGHSRALKHRREDQLYFPITMMSKRIRAKERVHVRELYDSVARGVRRLDARSR